MEKLLFAINKAKIYWWRLNDAQREHISKIFDTLAMGSIAPMFFSLVSNEIDGESLSVALCIISAILFELCAILALIKKEEE